ncbi:MAG TPA: glycoside hydrolase family 3 N-terminal domain-containing protein [Bacteroidales bacterium]|nr:glycoside hydrolase family 3 N-terminal domain-containing protein [Bacteroidales bacterium]
MFILTGLTIAQKTDPPFLKYINHPWVDSVLNKLTPDQRIAQSIWVAGWSNSEIGDEVDLAETIKKYGIGGIVFFQGTPEKQIELTNYYQKISNVPLLISMDAEWGAGMRLSGIDKFPFQMTLGAIRNDSLIYLFGKAVGDQCRLLGVHINLAPVADINNNPRNPVINYRSFGENRENVTSKASSYMKGMQDRGVMATAKHFPGHGDTDVDSHSDLPVIKHTLQRLDSIELYPFMRLISEGTGCIMTAHLNLPALDTVNNRPSSLSPVIINGLLKEKLGFKGLVITDAMNMKGVTKYFSTGKAEAMAYLAGNDVIEFVTDPGAAIAEISKLIASKKISQQEADLKCRKILALKYMAGLENLHPDEKSSISQKINSGDAKALIINLYANALTLLRNEGNVIPLKNLPETRIATVAINRNALTAFQSRLGDYKSADNYFINPADSAAVSALFRKLTGYNLVIAGVYGLDQRPDRGFGITPALDTFLEKLISCNKTVIAWFGNPYGLGTISSPAKAAGLLLAYQENDYAEDLSAQLIFGGIGARGSLPVTINETWPYNYGLTTPGNIRMQYGVPENAGMSSVLMERKIDSIVNIGLAQKAFPGCEVMASRKGIVIFRKSYGYQDYYNRIKVEDGDLFDLASVTKVAATLPSLMILDGEGKFSTDETLGHYLPFFKRSDKGNLKMSEILTHQAGLKAWISYWQETVKKDGKFRKHIYSPVYSEKYPLEVAEGLYISEKFRKRIYTDIKKSPLTEKKYLYSDLGFILSPEIIKNLAGEDLPGFVTDQVYKKIGAGDIVFNPLNKYPLIRIVPTEYDSLFRKQQLHGTVHDEGAAMMGGIAGHAGLFSTANDLMKLLEMYRRMGTYGGEQIIPGEVMEKYTSVQFPENGNRRGLGFDKPLLDNASKSEKDAYPSKSASPSSFGHSGYTGTFIWVDPEKELCFIFLSNRVYPTRNNTLISDLNIRTEILQAFYDSIIK